MKKSRFNYIIKIDSSDNYLIYNSLNSSLIEVDSEEYNLIDNLELRNSDQLTSVLTEYGIICENEVDEIDIAKRLVSTRMKGLKEAIKNHLILTIIPTFACNFRCIYCFESLRLRENKDVMSMEVQNSVLRFIEQEFKTGITFLRIDYFGGEPLYGGINIIKYIHSHILKLCHKYNVKVKAVILTNGLLINEKYSLIFKDLQINHFQVTIDGPKDVHNRLRYYPEDPDSNYDIILNNIKRTREYFRYDIRINVNAQNYHFATDLVNDFIEKNIWPHKNISFNLGQMHDGSEIKIDNKFNNGQFGNLECEFRQFLVLKYNELAKLKKAKYKFLLPKLIRSGGCSINYSNNWYSIAPDGRLYLCWDHMNSDDFVIGTINELLSREKKAEIKKVTDIYTLTLEKREEIGCFRCKAFPICEPECYFFYKHFNDLERNCSIWKNGIKNILLNQYRFYLNNPDIVYSDCLINIPRDENANL